MDIANECFNANVFFEDQKVYGLHRKKQILTAYSTNGKKYQYELERNGNILTIRSMQEKTLAEIIIINNDDITVMTDKLVWQGKRKVELFAYSNDQIEIRAD